MILQMLEMLEEEKLFNSQSADLLNELKCYVESPLLEKLFRELERFQTSRLARIPAGTSTEDLTNKLTEIQLNRRTLLNLADDVRTLINEKDNLS